MAGINSNITEKNYRKLVLRVSPAIFSYAVFDTLENKVLKVDSVDFSSLAKTPRIEDLYYKAFLDNTELTQQYDEVIALHDNNLNTFVPKALFDQDFLGSYLQFNTKVFETDFFAYDEIANYEMNNVYIPYVNINNFLIDQFGTFNYRHSNSVWVSKILDASKNVDQKQVFVHFNTDSFQLAVVQNQKLLLFNSFEFKTCEDFIYYLLFTAEQLNLNPESFQLHLLGTISEDSEYFKIAYKYVRNVALFDVSALAAKTGLSTSDNLLHYILLQS
ncbi:MAG TPA: DUF3822 family protein [Flavobacterium sp.]|nr:DUF3822 family protein [Flavobacterium sp.]